MKITILSIGKKPRGAELELIDEYAKRIQKPWILEWKFVPHQPGNVQKAKQDESSKLLEYISDNEFVVLLDERGKSINNMQLAEMFSPESTNQDIVFVIGGAYGVDERVQARADKVLSLSGLVFPHKIVRIVLAEQLYRSQAILQGHPYHHQ